MKIEKDGVGGGGGGGRGEENKIGSTVRWMIKRALKPYTVFFLSFFFFWNVAFERSHPSAQYENGIRSHARDVCVNGVEVFGFVRGSSSKMFKFTRSRVGQPVRRASESTLANPQFCQRFDIVFIVR